MFSAPDGARTPSPCPRPPPNSRRNTCSPCRPRWRGRSSPWSGAPARRWFAASDPPGRKLGSGGGVAHLLLSAWRETGAGAGFSAWLNASRKLLLMAGGQSRRLPAYAAVGKLLLPCKAWRGVPGQRLDQTLLDVQLPAYERVLAHAAGNGLAGGRVLVTSGDVVLRFGDDLPPLPDVDVLGLGMWVKPETAQGFGVFFCRVTGRGSWSSSCKSPRPPRPGATWGSIITSWTRACGCSVNAPSVCCSPAAAGRRKVNPNGR